MNKKHLDLELELKKHLDEVISSRKATFDDTKNLAINLWSLICDYQENRQSRRIVVQHFTDGKVITTMYTDRMIPKENKNVLVTFIDEKLVDYCSDFDLLQILSIIAESSDIEGKCRLCNMGSCNELHFDFKKKKCTKSY